jgi:hypothetical protein
VSKLGGPALNARNIAYWITTIVLAFWILSGGAAETVHYPANVEGIIVRLGYPLSFLTIIGGSLWMAARLRFEDVSRRA